MAAAGELWHYAGTGGWTVLSAGPLGSAFSLWGTADDHIAKLSELRDLGVDQFAIYLMHDSQEATLEAYGREIIPALQ